MGNSPLSTTELKTLRTQIEAGKRPGPRMFVAGPLVDGRPSGWKSKVIVTTEQAGRVVVDSLKKAGVDFVKVYDYLSAPVYFAIAQEAKKQAIPFVGHVPGSITAVEASKAGQKSIEHLSEMLLACSSKEEYIRQERKKLLAFKPATPEWLDQWNTYIGLLIDTYSEQKAKELFELFVKNSTWQCPTLTELYVRGYFIEASQAHPDRLKYLAPPIKDFWVESTQSRKNTFTQSSIELLKKQYQKHLQLVAAMRRAGVPILAGSDNLNPFIVPGFSLHDELELLVEAGPSPLEALQAATLNPAKYFGMTDSLGTVEEGRLADLLLLDANPLEDIKNTKKIVAVVANGRYFSKEELGKMLSAAEIAAKKQD